jgi:GntR family transcriptional regulator
MQNSLVRAPVYQQLHARLRESLSREYSCGDRFLTEREISERFEVSRATANKALASLVSAGLLEFRRGVGTFVRKQLIDYDVRTLVSFTEKARAAGKKPSTKLLAFGCLRAGEVEAAVRSGLRVESDSLLWALDRIRLADGVPVILEHRYIVHRCCPKLTKAQATGSLYEAWTEAHRLTIGGASEVIRAVMLGPEDARNLRTAAGAPALHVVSVGYLEDDSPLWWEETLYRADKYEFHSRLGPIKTAAAAQGKLRSHE